MLKTADQYSQGIAIKRYSPLTSPEMLTRLLYYVIIIPLSRLPFWCLYIISDGLYVIIYRILGYRKKVVSTNLKNSLSHLSESEIKRVESLFYHHLCDLVVESLKGFSITEEQVMQRMKFLNPEVFDPFLEKGQRVVLVGGHYGNWELFAQGIDQSIKHKAVALFTPLSNKFMNEKIKHSRSKYGLDMLSIHEIRENLASKTDELTATIFGSDQSPSKKQRAYWLRFLGQETALQFGTEKFAVEYDMPVIYGEIRKVKRGHFEVVFKVVCEDPKKVPFGYITQKHTRLLENAIHEQPEYWLWSHKRWKRKRSAEDELHENILDN